MCVCIHTHRAAFTTTCTLMHDGDSHITLRSQQVTTLCIKSATNCSDRKRDLYCLKLLLESPKLCANPLNSWLVATESLTGCTSVAVRCATCLPCSPMLNINSFLFHFDGPALMHVLFIGWREREKKTDPNRAVENIRHSLMMVVRVSSSSSPPWLLSRSSRWRQRPIQHEESLAL